MKENDKEIDHIIKEIDKEIDHIIKDIEYMEFGIKEINIKLFSKRYALQLLRAKRRALQLKLIRQEK